MYKNDSSGDYNLTIDLGYVVSKKGNSPNFKYNSVKNVPIIKRLTEMNTTYNTCKLAFHGTFNPYTNNCVYFVAAHKICLVLD